MIVPGVFFPKLSFFLYKCNQCWSSRVFQSCSYVVVVAVGSRGKGTCFLPSSCSKCSTVMVFRAVFCSLVTLEGQELSHSIIALWERLGVWVL